MPTVLAKSKHGDTYESLTDREHWLARPDTYVGSTQETQELLPVWENNKIVFRKVTYIPALLKIFDEILVNAADNRQRTDTTTKLKVTITENSFSVMNNGHSIPLENDLIVKLFGEGKTGSSFSSTKKKTIGGRNGFGAKLTNAFSTKFTVKVINNGQMCTVKWSDNMGKAEDAVYKKCAQEDSVTVSATPDLARFGMSTFTRDTMGLMARRVVDIAGTTPPDLKVWLNGKRILVKTFRDYVKLFYDKKVSLKTFCMPRWEVFVTSNVDDDQQRLCQMSFVNNIATTQGGEHTNYIRQTIMAALKKKFKKLAKLNGPDFNSRMSIFVNCLIDDPTFSSQTKVMMTSKYKTWGGVPKFPQTFIKSLYKLKTVEYLTKFAEHKESMKLARKTDGKKTRNISGIPKLDDANKAGTAQSHKCTLILTEGDSAKALAVSGLSVVGRDYYGVFPLKGKLLNVREASNSQLDKNSEFTNLKKILGLKQGNSYESVKGLRYGSVMIMTDQDHDGSHIKGLLINMFDTFWPGLLKIHGFLREFVTPIVKCHKGKQVLSFFTMPQYESWKKSVDTSGWKIKYYKGLGTSTAKEAKEYFSQLDRHVINFRYTETAADKIHMAFAKSRVEDRRSWLSEHKEDTFLDQDVAEVTYQDFVDKELILYSIASNHRAIPSMVDGLKPGQRKIIYGCLRRNLVSEIKVAQLAGYISEHMAYHHGEASLNATIVALAQDFVGAPNMPWLVPSGQFGTRAEGGKNAASPRYIFTYLQKYSKQFWNLEDADVLDILDDDGKKIEPKFMVGCFPNVLVNARNGIGTGNSTKLHNFNPDEVMANVRRCLLGEPMEPMAPWYRGFQGTMHFDPGRNSWVSQGIVHKLKDGFRVTELPVHFWTDNFKVMLDKMMVPDKKKNTLIVRYEEGNDDTKIDFKITMTPKQMAAVKDPVKFFRLSSNLNMSNMKLHDAQGHIKKYHSPEEIIEEWCKVRLETSENLRLHKIAVEKANMEVLATKARFIQMVVDGKIRLRNVSEEDVIRNMVALGFRLGGSDACIQALLRMSLNSLTLTKKSKLEAELEQSKQRIAWLTQTNALDMSLKMLTDFESLWRSLRLKRRLPKSGNGSKRKGPKTMTSI